MELPSVTEELLSGGSKASPLPQPDLNLPLQDAQQEPQPLQGLGRQMFASVAVALGSMLVGFSSAYTSPALVSMAQPNSTLSVTDQQGSWVGSLMPAAAVFGGMAGGFLIERLGRRATILATAPPFALAWLLIGLAVNVPMIYAGRIISGFCVGVTSLSLPVYMGETIQPEVRGMLGLISTTLGNIGILACFVLGKFLDWRLLAGAGALLTVPYAALTFCAPETPHWYLSKGRRAEAERALRWLRGGARSDVAKELLATEQGLGRGAEAAIGLPRSATALALALADPTDAKPPAKPHAPAPAAAATGLRALFTPAHCRPVGIALGLMLFQQFSGINAVIFYTVKIFQDAGSTVDKFVSTMVVGVVNLGAVVLATALIDRLGRRVLLGASAVAMALSLTVLGTFFYLGSRTAIDTSAFGWLPLLSFVVFVVGFSLGFGPIPWLMMGEILPADIRGAAASLATALNWSCTFVVTKAFPAVAAGVGSDVAFWAFGAVCAGATAFVLLCVPETRGRSLADIERRLARPRSRQRPRHRSRSRRISESVAGWTASVASIKPMPTGA